ncbi:MAG: hypothetical protein BACD_02541 [Bacteroides rodentium]
MINKRFWRSLIPQAQTKAAYTLSNRFICPLERFFCFCGNSLWFYLKSALKAL